MSKEPWLDSLPDDWVSQPPATPSPSSRPSPSLPTGSGPQSARTRKCIGCTHRSRLPRPPHHPPPGIKGKGTLRIYKQAQAKRAGNDTPSPSASPRLNNSPAKGASQGNTKPGTPSRKKPSSTPLKNMASVRRSSNVSSHTPEQGTVQVRPTKGDAKGTPEWRRRLIRGEMPADEPCDLFAPLGLESIFKPPPAGCEPEVKRSSAIRGRTDGVRSADEEPSDNQNKRDRGTCFAKNKNIEGRDSSTSTQDKEQDKENREHHPGSNESDSISKPDNTGASQLSNYGLDGVSDMDVRMRSASRQEEIRNEGITPILLSRSNTANCRTTSGVLKSALKQLNDKLERFSQDTTGRPASETGGGEGNTQPEDLLDVTSQSLPADLSTGTQDIIKTKPFVNFRRGGYSDDSSFHMRPLSPSSFPSQVQSSSPLANSKIRSSPPPYDTTSPPQHRQFSSPDAVYPPAIKLSPARDPGPDRPESRKMNSSGSPLKLFGNHDTFTNNKLLRRMSQFEETFEGISEEDEPASPSLKVRRKRANRSLPNLRRGLADDHSTQKTARPESQDAADPHMTRFGSGQLDNFNFENETSHRLNVPRHPFEHQRPLYAGLQSRSFSRDTRRDSLWKAKSLDSIPERRRFLRDRQRIASRRFGASQPAYMTTELPRLNTPGRSSTPKRRRTLQKANEQLHDRQRELDMLTESMRGLSLLQISLEQQGINYDTQSGIDLSQPARQSRSPTPSQMGALGDRNSQSKRGDKSHGADTIPEGRKRSLTTQDFLDEATKIMSMIRAKGKYKNGLASVEESDIASVANVDETYTEESSRENLSRPPSRDGVDMRKLREPRQLDPRIVSHLRKFEDKDDMELLMGASVMSLHLDKERKARGNKENNDGGDNEVEYSPPNIRIRDNTFIQRKRKHSSDSDHDQPNHEDLLTVNTQASSGSSNGHSVPTGSSSSSNAKGVIPSDMVSHLIPEQVNGMVYDRSNHTWVKKNVSGSVNRSRGDDSEEDPFGSIPDLSVDEIEEMKRVQQFISPNDQRSAGQGARVSNTQSNFDQPESQPLDCRPSTRDGARSIPDSSSVQSKLTRFTSSGPRPETRATSWGSDDLTENNGHKPDDAAKHQRLKDIEHEIELHDGHTHTLPRQPEGSGRQPRVVTISFSSPLVSQVSHPDDDGGEVDEQMSKHRVAVTAPSRHTSLDGKPFVGRPISRIEEQNEDSPDSLSLVRRDAKGQIASSPLSNGYPSSAGHDSSYSFHLSPLPDFTVHQVDDPLHLELSYIAQRTHPSSLRQVHGTFALAAEDLVKHITDVEPYEPYWEHIRRLNLRGKGLITLHRLNDFCPRLEELDVSENDLGQLSGAPSTLRTLSIQHNCLSNLTAWGHLVNLQYLDVSGNQLESLDGFSGLIHLRELRANNNKIRNIDGILDLNGLLSLELRHNALTTVDFEGAELTRLRELDLSNNQLTAVRNIHFLPALESLDLNTNQVDELHSSMPLRNIRFLRLSNNRLRSFDAAIFPHLTLLYLDKNYLSTVNGLEKCSHLEVLSLREQMSLQSTEPASILDIDISAMKDIRKLFLSSNRLSERILSPSVPVLSLQLLDLASCGLNGLPAHFGASFPNLRVLNLNFNALTELRGIKGMNGLGRLTVVGNRVSRLRTLCQVIGRLGRTDRYGHSSLRTIDLRGNPLTVGFYPPPVSGSGRNGNNAKTLEFALKSADGHKEQDENRHTALATFGRCADIALPELANEVSKIDIDCESEVEIDDPYTIPPADAEADRKYRSRLDESTRVRRMVVELMIYAGSGGAIRVLDGLELRPILEDEKAEMDRVWNKLEDLGVLKKVGGFS
ncbi:hypothetical protein VTN77DRAFT_288 [Rasamsonia byssochlamydoides]|uniref:uncharacterized protein n=1 Tax=Rasamsonia byssochlamydoides TaxID=89139 RepID=UPI003742378B